MMSRTIIPVLGVMIAALSMTSGHTENLKLVSAIAIPGTPIDQFGALFIDQKSGLGYLADKDNKGLLIFDTKTNAFVKRVTGFVGLVKKGTASGPNGIVVVGEGAAAEVWVSDGDSTIKIVDPHSATIKETLATGGELRANNMAYDPKNKVVIVPNSNEDIPFLSLISTEPGHRIMSKFPMDDSAENIERSVYHAGRGMFFTVFPVLRSAADSGALVQTDPASGKVVKIYPLKGCHPHSLSIVSETKIFLGCSSAHGPNGKPGGDLGIFDIEKGMMTETVPGLGGNSASAANPERGLYFHAGGGEIKVIDAKTAKLIERVKTSEGARSVDVLLSNNHLYLATSAKSGPCGGCIQVYAFQ